MNEPQKPWKPILQGEDAARAIAVVREIAAALEDDSKVTDPSLASGKAGIALFFAYLHEAFPDEGHDETAFRYLQGAIDGLPQLGPYPALYGGITGIAWATEHLAGKIFDPGDEDPNAEIDAMLASLLARSPWEGDYDLVSGLVGFGVYALERLPRPGSRAREILESIVARLDEMAERQPNGEITWLTRPELLPEHQRKEAPQGYYNLGMAHGVPGVVSLLASVVSAGVARDRARGLLDGAVRWILAQRLPNSPGASFPYWVGPGIKPMPSRTAWCYGDPGVVVALLKAGKALGDAALVAEATRLAVECAGRPMEKAGVVDAELCHGTAGVGHILNRLFHESDQRTIESASATWQLKTLSMREAGKGIAGYLAWHPTKEGEAGWREECGLLTGAGGIGLALVTAIAGGLAKWDAQLGVAR